MIRCRISFVARSKGTHRLRKPTESTLIIFDQVLKELAVDHEVAVGQHCDPMISEPTGAIVSEPTIRKSQRFERLRRRHVML